MARRVEHDAHQLLRLELGELRAIKQLTQLGYRVTLEATG